MFTDTRGLRARDVLFWGRWMLTVIVPLMSWAGAGSFSGVYVPVESAFLAAAFAVPFLAKRWPEASGWWFALVGIDLAAVTALLAASQEFPRDAWSLYIWCVVEASMGLRSKFGLLTVAAADVLSLASILPWSGQPGSWVVWLEHVLVLNLATLPFLFVTYWETRRRREAQDQLEALRAQTSRIKELEHINRQMADYTMDVQNLAVIDQLTGLFNQTHFHNRVVIEVEKARQTSSSVVLLLIDIDGFKSFNDRFGHYLGDDVLRTVAQIIHSSVRDKDLIAARIGGEEFVVMMPAADLAEGEKFGDSLRRAIADTVLPGPAGPLRVTVSVGVARFPDTASDATELVRQADFAMYRAKESGKNRVLVYGSRGPSFWQSSTQQA